VSAFRLEQGESVADGIRRIARGRIDHALDELHGRTDSTSVEAVHEARKDMKKLRALLRLMRGELGKSVCRSESARFRDAARELAGVRDADVMLETLAGLEEPYPGLRQALEAHRIRTSAGGRSQAAGAAIEVLKDAREQVEEWPLERDGFSAFEKGLRRTYRQGRRDFRAARAEPTSEALHEWRKRVKDLWYHLSILQESWKPVMKAMADEAHELSDRLGDDHDLATLLEWSREHAPAEELELLVVRRREELQAEAFAYGAKLYADKPKLFAARIEAWWEAGRAIS